MGKPAAKKGDHIIATDTHIVMIPSPPGSPVPTPQLCSFSGIIDRGLSTDVNIMGLPAAVESSTATNIPFHLPQGGVFQKSPANKGTIIMGSATVSINGKMAARAGDKAATCNDPVELPIGTVVATGTVFIGG